MGLPKTSEVIDFSKEIDCRGQLCPMPVYKTSLALRKLAVGEVLKVICTDPGSLGDMPALARQTGSELLATDQSGAEQTYWLRKGAAY